MKSSASIVAAALALVLTAQAYAVMPSDALVNRMNSVRGQAAISGPVSSPQLGGDGGTNPPGGIDPISCPGSPENATVLLALISGMGLLLGRQITRTRSARPAAVIAQ